MSKNTDIIFELANIKAATISPIGYWFRKLQWWKWREIEKGVLVKR